MGMREYVTSLKSILHLPVATTCSDVSGIECNGSWGRPAGCGENAGFQFGTVFIRLPVLFGDNQNQTTVCNRSIITRQGADVAQLATGTAPFRVIMLLLQTVVWFWLSPNRTGNRMNPVPNWNPAFSP